MVSNGEEGGQQAPQPRSQPPAATSPPPLSTLALGHTTTTSRPVSQEDLMGPPPPNLPPGATARLATQEDLSKMLLKVWVEKERAASVALPLSLAPRPPINHPTQGCGNISSLRKMAASSKATSSVARAFQAKQRSKLLEERYCQQAARAEDDDGQEPRPDGATAPAAPRRARRAAGPPAAGAVPSSGGAGADADAPPSEGGGPPSDQLVPGPGQGAAEGPMERRKKAGLMEAVAEGEEGEVGSLLRRGGEVDVLDSGGATPLMLACHQGNPQLVQLLLDYNASVTARTTVARNSVMHFAAKNGSEAVIKLLMERDATLLDAPNKNLDTPLMMAVLARNHMAARSVRGVRVCACVHGCVCPPSLLTHPPHTPYTPIQLHPALLDQVAGPPEQGPEHGAAPGGQDRGPAPPPPSPRPRRQRHAPERRRPGRWVEQKGREKE